MSDVQTYNYYGLNAHECWEFLNQTLITHSWLRVRGGAELSWWREPIKKTRQIFKQKGAVPGRKEWWKLQQHLNMKMTVMSTHSAHRMKTTAASEHENDSNVNSFSTQDENYSSIWTWKWQCKLFQCIIMNNNYSNIWTWKWECKSIQHSYTGPYKLYYH